MRTTIRVDDQLFAELRLVAAKTGRTLTAVIDDALRESLSRRKTTSQRGWISLPSGGEGGLRPGVSLDNTAELLDLMDEADATG